ncbi:hypothetical protein RCZ15_04770 [Capnocytophaga catalasegens]|uniref:Uncharacterized protein n=2 Tax=Capnocytophaga catalasegens TaxID=1004260 RepID=A0AAV5AVP0_9FLAO|nr:hypothetical protein RCZ03_17610 [Capnocytophaga catalasegens]GJM49502.1 hypothetical protein RCZ15_04770 [Capnocytophaga catalasegens]GJM54228.1 hypothetical protein RCZ16_25440 [Capnocytophaga catalasegens]
MFQQEKKIGKMLEIAIMAKPYFQLVWAEEIATSSTDNRAAMVDTYVHYNAILTKFIYYANVISMNLESTPLTNEELADLIDALADTTVFVTEKSVCEQIQWLVEELSNLKTA